MEKYGFVYLWKDQPRNRYYVGSHWGTENDGYVCSSPAMYEAHKRRPQDFKRRILKKITTNRIDLLTEEQRWIDMIGDENFGRKYYNISSKVHYGHWWINETTKKIVIDKLSALNKGNIPTNKGVSMTPKQKEKMSQAKLGKTYEEIYGDNANLMRESRSNTSSGKIISEEQKQIIRNYMTNHNPMKGRTGINHPRYGKSHVAWNKGKSWDEETKTKMGIARKGKGLGNKNGFQKGQVPWNKGINKT